MHLNTEFWFRVRLVLTCIIWYCVSSAGSIVNKLTLQRYPYPMTVALASLICIPLYSEPLLRYWGLKRQGIVAKHHWRQYVVPIGVGKALAAGSAYFSLWKMPVSYAHTVKASMPLFAVLVARFILKEHPSKAVYLSLLPIVAGVVIASATEISFSAVGLGAALLSTFIYALLNVLVKKVLKETGMHPMRLLTLNTQVAAVLFFPFWLYNDLTTMVTDYFDTQEHRPDSQPPDLYFMSMLAAAGLFSFGQNMCAFCLIHQLTALSYAVTNATKRITVIAASLLTLHNPVTAPNVFGMFLAVAGVFCYNRAKQKEHEKARETLPLTRTHTTLSDASLIAMDPLEKNDTLYWASKGNAANGGSRLAALSVGDEALQPMRRLDEIAEKPRRMVKFA